MIQTVTLTDSVLNSGSGIQSNHFAQVPKATEGELEAWSYDAFCFKRGKKTGMKMVTFLVGCTKDGLCRMNSEGIRIEQRGA